MKIGVIFAVVLILAMGSCRLILGSANSRIAKVEGELAIEKANSKAADANLKDALARLESVQATSKAATDAANAKLAALAVANSILDKDLEAEKAKSKVLTSDALASSLQSYIGEKEVSATASGSFSLTRLGAESTRNIFLGATATGDKLANCESARDQDAVKLQAQANVVGPMTEALGQCQKARLSDKEVIDLLKKEVSLEKSKARWDIVKASIPAAIVGGVIVFLVKK